MTDQRTAEIAVETHRSRVAQLKDSGNPRALADAKRYLELAEIHLGRVKAGRADW